MYKESLISKTGIKIPVLKSGRTLESRYDPEKDAERQFLSYKGENFVVVTGNGSGILIKKLLESTKAEIIILERSQNDFDFLKKEGFLEKENERLHFATLETFSSVFTKNYLPSFHGNLCILENKAWLQEIPGLFEDFQRVLDASLNSVKADFSVQAHFGKIWQENIINNLKNCNFSCKINIPKDKKAVILGAGPSIDDEDLWERLKKNDCYIIATDTSFSVLSKRHVIPDAVITLDAQNLSHTHFMHKIFEKTLFIIDLCSNPSIVKYLSKHTKNIVFSASGHPLSGLAKKISPSSFIQLQAGSGTVTMAALDFARQAGFKKIELYGADSAYHKGKSYARGTYLDTLYQISSSKNKPLEQIFDSLIYRTPLTKNKINGNEVFQSQVLQSYQNSIENFLSSIGTFTRKYFSYFVEVSDSKTTLPSSVKAFDFEIFRNKVYSLMNETFNQHKKNAENILIELPFIARLRLKTGESSTEKLYEAASKELLRLIK
ncbi:MAG: DUF115 domain-containing protein [Treponema sp.]|nr:DUF115 domain-containing protein [Treponema sp.]